jgi:Thioesterase-like superfamily
VPAALFVPDRGRLRPTDLARGPWSPDALHGGPIAAVLARAVEACDTLVPMRVARLTVELLRPVPLAPLLVTARIVRAGKRVQLVEGSVIAGETEVARVTALQIRTAAVPVPEPAPLAPTPSDPLAAPELDAVTRLSQDGVGQAESLLFDPERAFGRAVQSPYVDAR